MKRKAVKVRLSPNEEAKLIREERERRRILRIQQVREQQRDIAQHVRQRVEQRRLQELELLGEELRAQWEQKQKERVEHLQRLYQENLSLLGQGHRNAKENHPDQDAAVQKAESEIKAEERYRKALKELKLQRVKNQENQSRSIDARRKALEVEKIRSTKVASLPLPPAQPLQSAVSKSPHLVKKCNASSFAASHYHMPETFVDRETSTSQPSACVEAEQEEQWMLMQRQEAQRRGEQQEKARLRGREALKREQLLQDRGRFLMELEHMQQTDLLRRRRQVGDMPPQIFEPLYRRQETQLDRQRNMEFAFEDMYSGERRVKGDVLCHLVPEPLPPPPTDSLCQDLDVSQDELTTTDQYPVEQDQKPHSEECQAQHEGITPDTVKDPSHSEAKEGKAVPPRRGLKRLLTRIQTQRRHWSNSEVVSADSPCGQDSSIDTGSLTTPDKLSKADVEHLEPVADETQESEEQKQKEEKLEQERQEQIELLKRLEEQRLELEERLSEAHRERTQLKTSMLPTLLRDTPSEPVAANHASMMEEHRNRLLQQKEIHQRSVEVARQRLEEYQRALRIRYNMRTVPRLVVPPSASQSSAIPASITHVTVPPALLPTPVSPASFLRGVVTPLPVPQNSVPPRAVLHPMDVTPTAVAPVVASSLSVAPPAFLHAAVTPSSVTSTFLTASVPLPVATHIAGRHLHPGCPTAEVQTHAPRDAVPRDMGPLHAPRSDFDSGSKEELTTLKHKVFLRFLQERLGVTQTDAGNTSQPSPAVSAAPGPSVPTSTNLSSCSVIPATSATNLVISSRSGVNASVCTVVSSAPTFTMATGSDTVIPTSNPSDSTFTHPGLSVARGVAVERAGVGPDLIGVTRERLESRLDENALSQPKHKVDKQEPKPKAQDQAHSNVLQALLRALERSSIGTLQHEGSDPPSSSGSRSASSGCFSVESGPPPAASKPPVSRAWQGCADAVLHQLSVIEEVNTPASVSLLTGEDAVNADDFQCSKQADSLPSPSCTLLDFAKCTDSPQSHSFTTEANNSGSSVVSSFKHSIEPSCSSHPSFSSTISTGSYITTDPDLQGQSDIDCIPVESPSSSSAQRGNQNQERILDQGNTPQIQQFAPLENAEVLPADEPSGLRIEDSFRPLEAQMSDLSMCSATDEVTMGTQETPAVEDGTPSLELLVGHPSAHSSMIGQMLGSSPLMTWSSAESHWREGLSYAPSQTWQSTGQVSVPTEPPLMHPENDSRADPSTSSEFHHLHAEVTHNQTETKELSDQPGKEPWSLEQMRAEDCGHVGLSQCSPPEVLFFPSLKNTVEGMGILEQSQITLVSLTDSSSDEQEPVAKEEEPGAWGP